MNTLFIGGHQDGTRRHVADGYNELAMPTRDMVERYHLCHLNGVKATFKLYVLEGMTPDDVMARLIKRYVGEKPVVYRGGERAADKPITVEPR